GGLGATAGARRGRPQRATGGVRGGRCTAHARIAGASLARELAGGVAATPQTSAPRAASLPGPARDRRDRARSVRRAAARSRAPEALRWAAVRVPRVLSTAVRLQYARARYDRGRRAAGRCARRATNRRRMGRRRARPVGEGHRQEREE